MDAFAIIKIVSIVAGLLGTFASIVWGYSKLNSKAEQNKIDNQRVEGAVKSLDSKTSEAVVELHKRIEQERQRSEEREDKLHERINAWNRDLSELHKDVLRALPNNNNK